MTALRSRDDEIASADREQTSSLTEDYVGLASYLAQAIARGDVNFDAASAELQDAASDTEQGSLRRAAAAASRQRSGSLVARLLGRSVEARR